MKHSIFTVLISASILLLAIGSCCKQPVQATQTKWRTEYVRDTSTALCNRITNADSAIAYMDHLFVPLYSGKGIQLNRAVEQSALVWVPGVSSKSCIIQNYFCPTYLIGRDVEVAFALFAHPTQLQEWRNLSKSFTDQDREWNLFIEFQGIYCESSSPIKVRNGKIVWVK
jgi:hypothetical protein